MDRKQFLTQIAAYGVASTGVATLAGFAPRCASAGAATEATGTPCEKKQEFAQVWIKRLMDNMDKELDEPTRKRLMAACGRSCYIGAHGDKPFPGGLDAFIELVKSYAGEVTAIRREGNTVYFAYVKNPAELRVADGWCLCPLVERGPEGLSGSYCDCSVGYVTEMFSGAAGKPVRVELTESLKRGGKACRFTIHV